MSHALKPAPDKAIFRVSEDFSQLMLLREIMASEGEDTAAIDSEIAEYFGRSATRERIDTVIGFLRYAEAQENAARNESWRIEKLANSWKEKREYLKSAAKAVLENSGQKALEGSTAGKLVLKGNGGKQALEITDASLIPEELCDWQGKIQGGVMYHIREVLAAYPITLETIFRYMERVPHNERIRAALEAKCSACNGYDPDGLPLCSQCDGDCKGRVPGARLLERGSHVSIA